MADEVGVSRQTVWNWTQGENRPTGLQASALEAWAGLPVDALMAQNESEPPTQKADGSKPLTDHHNEKENYRASTV